MEITGRAMGKQNTREDEKNGRNQTYMQDNTKVIGINNKEHWQS